MAIAWVGLAGGAVAVAAVGLLLAWALVDQAADRLRDPAVWGIDPAWRVAHRARLREVGTLLLGCVGLLVIALAACVVALGGL